jgi:protein TonB
MEANKILSSSLLDVLFEKRNKEYGAYDLRNSYNKRIGIALGVGMAVVGLFTLGTVLAGNGGKGDVGRQKITSVDLIDIEVEKKVEIIPPPKVTPPPVQAVKQEIYTTYKVVDDKDVTKPPTSIEDLDKANIGLVKVDGDDATGIATPDVIPDAKGLVEPQAAKPEGPFTKVEVEASFPGGAKKWQQFLERNCNGQVASENGAAAGRYTVIIRFVVDENGVVSDIQPLSTNGHGMEEEAVKVVKKAASMKWNPAIQNGRMVKAYRTQPIIFMVEGE